MPDVVADYNKKGELLSFRAEESYKTSAGLVIVGLLSVGVGFVTMGTRVFSSCWLPPSNSTNSSHPAPHEFVAHVEDANPTATNPTPDTLFPPAISTATPTAANTTTHPATTELSHTTVPTTTTALTPPHCKYTRSYIYLPVGSMDDD